MGMLVELLIFFCESNENVAVCHHLTIRRLLIVNWTMVRTSVSL